MPKKKQKFTVKGKSVQDLVNLTAAQVRDLNRSGDLGKVVTRLSSAANKRMRRFEKAGISTPASRAAKKGGKFSGKGKKGAELLAEYQRVKGFLTSETSTQKGYKKFQKRMKEGFKKAGIDIGGKDVKSTEKLLENQIQIYEWLKERNPWIAETGYKYSVHEKVSNMLQEGDLSVTVIKRRMDKMLQEEYQREQEEYTDVSDFFDIDEED